MGQVIRRDEQRNGAPSQAAPHEVWCRFNGNELGYNGNNGTFDVSTDRSIAQRQQGGPNSPGTFKGGKTSGLSYADFTKSYDPLNSYNQGSTSNSYTVRGGETLQSIAANVYGDSSLWYKVAEANGLSGSSPLIAGQTLRLPAGVSKSTHNADSFKAYNPGEAIGDLSPTNAAPPKKNGCAVFGQILLSVVAIAATAFAGPAAIGALKGLGTLGAGIVGGAIGGAAGSVASQAVGLATGIQDKFSFKGVATSAIAGGVGGGLGASGLFGEVTDGVFKAGSLGIKSSLLSSVAQGAVGSAINQGIGVATGLQNKFSFAGVAAAGVGAGVGSYVGGKLGTTSFSDKYVGLSTRNIAGHALSGAAISLANAATRSAIEGSSFGANIKAAIPDVIGSTIGNIIGGAVSGGGNALAKIERANAQVQLDPTNTEARVDYFLNSSVIPADLKGQVSTYSYIYSLIDAGFSDQEITSNFARGEGGFSIADNEIPILADVDAENFSGNENQEFEIILARRRGKSGSARPNAVARNERAEGILEVTGEVIEAILAPNNVAEIQRDYLLNESARLKAAIKRFGFKPLESAPSEGKLSNRGLVDHVDSLRFQRAALEYNVNGTDTFLVRETLVQYQKAIDRAYRRGIQEIPKSSDPNRLKLGNFIDKEARQTIRFLLNRYGVKHGSGQHITVNNRDYGDARTSETRYRIPDIRIGNIIYDGSLTDKNRFTPQVQGYLDNRPNAVVKIVRPTGYGNDNAGRTIFQNESSNRSFQRTLKLPRGR